MVRLASLFLASILCLGATAEEFVDWEMVGKIRDEGFRRSQMEQTIRQLTDGIGPRITNSPQMREASRWALAQFESWGLQNGELIPFEFGAGWSYESCRVDMIQPARTPLEALPLAWTPGTEGPLRGMAMEFVIEDLEAFEKWLEENDDDDLTGKILFMSKKRDIDLENTSMFTRHDDESLTELCGYEIPSSRDADAWRARRDKRLKLQDRFFALAAEKGVVAFVEISSRDYGVVRATNGGEMELSRRATIPGFALNAEHYNRVLRDLEKGDVELEIDIRASFHDENTLAENTVAEIPGHGKKRELVMAGAHLDSWHGATGATDNGAGSAVVLEAARILMAVDAKMERTVRFALWSGEEQGLLGSEAYVDHTFVERPPVSDPDQLALPMRYRKETWPLTILPDHERFCAYFNLDNGTGKIRGIHAQENSGVVPIFRAWLEPFEDLGAAEITMRNTGGTDHLSFDRVGLPGFQFIQDPMSYFTRTHHTNLDLYDNLSIEDLQQSAVIMASFIYHAANRPEKLPRKTMPQPPPVEEPREEPALTASSSR